jgi:hypothetical protein
MLSTKSLSSPSLLKSEALKHFFGVPPIGGADHNLDEHFFTDKKETLVKTYKRPRVADRGTLAYFCCGRSRDISKSHLHRSEYRYNNGHKYFQIIQISSAAAPPSGENFQYGELFHKLPSSTITDSFQTNRYASNSAARI